MAFVFFDKCEWCGVSYLLFDKCTPHRQVMSVDRDIRYELLARLCPNTIYYGAELPSVCTEAGMYAIRARRKSVSEKDFLDSISKVIYVFFWPLKTVYCGAYFYLP